MENFNQHRTQIAVEYAINDPFEFKISDINYNSLLVKSKEQMANELKDEFSNKLELETESLKQQLEIQYRTEAEDLKTKLNQQELNISNLKDQIRGHLDVIGNMEEEQKKREVEIELLHEKIESSKFFKIETNLVFSFVFN